MFFIVYFEPDPERPHESGSLDGKASASRGYYIEVPKKYKLELERGMFSMNVYKLVATAEWNGV